MNPLLGVFLIVAFAVVSYLLFRVVERMLYRYIKSTMPRRARLVITERHYTVSSDADFARQKALADKYLAEMTDIDYEQDRERYTND